MKKLFCFAIVVYFVFTAKVVYAQTDTLTIDGLKRVYFVHVPSSYNENVSVPLVIAIHNAYGTASSFETLTGFSTKADLKGFIAAYPSGTGNPTSWNAGSCCYSAASSNMNDIGFISAIIDTLTKKYNIDAARIFIAGFSNGSMMAYRAAAELSAKVAAAAAVSGQMVLSDFRPARPVSIISFHTLDDSSVPYNGNSIFPSVESVISQWCNNNSCAINPDTIFNTGGVLGRKWKSNNADADVILYRLNTGGHTWPASVVSATNLIWDFFESHPMKSVTEVSQEPRLLEPGSFYLNQNYPNPFNPNTVVSFIVYKRGFATIKIFNLFGQEVQTLLADNIDAGYHAIHWTPVSLSSGIYFYQLSINGYAQTKKLIFLK